VQLKKLVYRLSTAYHPISQAQTWKFPPTDKLDYNNYMIGVEDSKDTNVEYRMILKDQSTCNTKAVKQMHRVLIHPADAIIKKIEIGHGRDGYEGLLCGFRFYDQNGAVVLQTGYDWVKGNNHRTLTEILQEGERIIGYISRDWKNDGYANHCDFQFVIGRLV
jgi:hypothetical protein